MMIILLAKTQGPSVIDVAEALCDSIIHNDKKTQELLCTIAPIPITVQKSLEEISSDHVEIGRVYNGTITKEYDDADSSYAVVDIPLNAEGESISFTCRHIVQQWSVVGIKLNNSNEVALER